jgi:hypothetical protein
MEIVGGSEERVAASMCGRAPVTVFTESLSGEAIVITAVMLAAKKC